MPSFSESVGLVLAGGASTGLIALATAWQQNRFARTRATRERAAQLQDSRRSASREHALELHDALDELGQIGLQAIRNDGATPTGPRVDELLANARRTYLLIADEATRSAISDGMTVFRNGASRDVSLRDWYTSVSDSAFVLAAYIRGDMPSVDYVKELSGLRSKYGTQPNPPHAEP